MYRVHDMTARGFQGSLTGLSLVEVLQMCNIGRRTASLQIEGSAAGSIDFVAGRVVHAECAGLSGVVAFERLLRSNSGQFRTVARTNEVQTIERPFDQLMMDALRAPDANLDVPSEDDLFAGLEDFRSWNAPPGELQSPIVVPQPAALPSIEHVDPGHSGMHTREGTVLLARWQTVLERLRSIVPSIAIGVSLVGGAPFALVGTPDDGLREQLGHFARFTANSAASRTAVGMFDCVEGRTALAVLWSRPGAFAVSLSDATAARSEIAAFRVGAAAIARVLLGPDAAIGSRAA